MNVVSLFVEKNIEFDDIYETFVFFTLIFGCISRKYNMYFAFEEL